LVLSSTMITSIHIQNYRSFVDAKVNLKPFSLVVGANGSGKSNLLRFFRDVAIQAEGKNPDAPMLLATDLWTKHQNKTADMFVFDLTFVDDTSLRCERSASTGRIILQGTPPWTSKDIPIFNLNPASISAIEPAIPKAAVKADGSGTTQVLDTLKNGDREDLFDKIEENFRRYVPEVEKLSLRTVKEGTKQIQVREKGLKDPVPATELSEGTRLILAILTILHQETPPPVILLEDIDRGLHPRLFEFVAPLMRDIAERNQVNILATTHNPYLVDCFQDDKEAVIVVEKKNGESTLSTLASRLEGLDYDKVDPEDMPLGNLWFSGFVGGVPSKSASRPHR
jgi:predicted ATPase